MKKFFNKFNQWFEIYLGWFFVNGMKETQWFEKLRKKYQK